MQTRDTTHLGDGAYVGHDGYQLWLGANDHRNMTVALEPGTFAALVRYAHRVLGWRVTLPEEQEGDRNGREKPGPMDQNDDHRNP